MKKVSEWSGINCYSSILSFTSYEWISGFYLRFGVNLISQEKRSFTGFFLIFIHFGVM